MSVASLAAERPPLARTGVVDALAGALRRDILSGGLRDGDLLPKQDDLLARYRVGRTTLRQALRVLESEGLVTVRRGRLGGAVVHVPQAADAARTVGMVLQARHVPLEDLAVALRRVEPVCAALCAERPDRAGAVVPRLEAALEGAEESVDDLTEFLRGNRRFHETVVACCGNETMRLLLGTIETLWTVQEPDWAQAVERLVDRTDRAAAVRAHRAIVRRIAHGDAAGTYHLARRHIEVAQAHPLSGPAVRHVQVLDPVHGWLRT